jgi:hypothetical protein
MMLALRDGNNKVGVLLVSCVDHNNVQKKQKETPNEGIEPSTTRLRVVRSAN